MLHSIQPSTHKLDATVEYIIKAVRHRMLLNCRLASQKKWAVDGKEDSEHEVVYPCGSGINNVPVIATGLFTAATWSLMKCNSQNCSRDEERGER